MVSDHHKRRIQEARDLCGLPYHRLGELYLDKWPRAVRREVLRAIVELRLYRLCMPFRERYLEFVDELLGPQQVEVNRRFSKVG